MDISVNNNPNIYDNTNQNIICIDEYRMKDYLREFQDSLIIKPELYTSIGLFFALLIAVVTAEFKNLGLTASTWQALFILLCIASFCWMVFNIIQYCKYRKNKKTVESVIKDMLKNQVLNKTDSANDDMSMNFGAFMVRHG